jgi:hypothetical protein
VWDGNYDALGVTERLGQEESGDVARVGPVCCRWDYNTAEEIGRFGEMPGKLLPKLINEWMISSVLFDPMVMEQFNKTLFFSNAAKMRGSTTKRRVEEHG